MTSDAPLLSFALSEIATASAISKRTIERRATRQQWPYIERPVRGGMQRLYAFKDLPADLQAALAIAGRVTPAVSSAPASRAGAAPSAARTSPTGAAALSSSPAARKAAVATQTAESLWGRHERAAPGCKARAGQLKAAVDAVAALVDAGRPVRQAIREVVAQGTETEGTLLKYWYDVQPYAREDWLAALTPGWTGRTLDTVSPEAWDFFKGDYLRLEAPKYSAVYDRLTRTAKVRGWIVPSLGSLKTRLDREVPKAVQVLARRGTEAFARTMPAQRRDRSVFTALGGVNADGHRFDVFAKWPDGTVARPVMVGWQDLMSGKLLAKRVDRTEHSGLVRLSFGDLIEQYGIPGAAWLDNGRSFAAKFITGGMANRYRFKVREEDPAGLMTQLIGADNIHWTTPYHGQAKPIERAWLDLCEYVAKHPAFAGAYVGNNPMAKPENYGSRAVPIADFLAVLDEEIAAHNARPGRTGGLCAGRSFDQTFAESYQEAGVLIRMPTAEQRRWWMLAAESVSLARSTGEIKLLGNFYWHESLVDHAGDKAVVRFDPDHLHKGVHVYTMDGRYITDAECTVAAGFNDLDAARDLARAKSQRKKHAKGVLDAERRMDALQVAALMPRATPAEPMKAPKVVRMATGDAAPGKRAAAGLQGGGNEGSSVIAAAFRPVPKPAPMTDEEFEARFEAGFARLNAGGAGKTRL